MSHTEASFSLLNRTKGLNRKLLTWVRLVTNILLERLQAIWFFKRFFVSDDNLNMGMFKKITTVLSFAIAMLLSFSTQAAGMYTTYQAKIIKPDGTPLESTNVNFRFTILNPLGACILYAENFNTINMAGSGGLVNFSLGSGIKTFPVSGSVNFSDVFNNDGTALSCAAGGPPAYIPAANDLRKIVMQFHDGLGWQTLPAMNINHVPYAMYAKNSTQLNGKTDLDFVQVTSIPTCSVSQALQFNGASFGCVAVGSSSTDGLLSVSGTAPIMVSGSASAPVISISVASMSSDGYLTAADYAEFKTKMSVSSTEIANALGYAPVSSSAVATQITAQISAAAAVSNTANTLLLRDSSGNIWANDVYANSTRTNYVDIFKPSTAFSIRLQAPISLSAGYNLIFPSDDGLSGQFLTTDGSGNLSWTSQTITTISSSDVVSALGYTPANAASAGVTILNGSASATQTFANGTTGTTPAFVTVNGVHTLNIPLASAGSVTAGLISNTDYQTFANKLSATSASVISVLGYTPVSSTALGNYLVKTNNLSDLSSSASARTNLGLGGFATVSSLDLGSASATGILAEARLPSSANVTSGSQYTKVTVDGKGRVTSGAQLSASDVATALGYTPQASGAVSSQWTTSGTTINYASGNVGIGTVNPTTPLYVEGNQTLTGWLFMSGGHIVMNNDASIRFKNAANTENRDVMRMNSANTLEITNNTDGNGGDIRFQTLSGGNESLRITSAGTVGIGTNTPITKLSVSGGIQISMESAPCALSYAGTLRYNSGNVEYCNGSTWSAFGVAGSGITAFNGSTSGTQTFANGTAGTTPAFVTVNGMHTLNIPLASSGAVTAGLISNSDYTTLMNKVSMTTLSNYVLKSNNLSDLTSSATARANLGLGGFATVSSLDLGSASATGIISEARLMTFSGVASGAQYTKVTVDSKGRVTSGSQVTLNDIVHVHTGNGGLFVGSGTSWPLVEDSNNSESTAFGVNSMAANQDGGQNTAFGFGTLESSVTSYENAAFGWYALQANTSGQFNTAIGAETLWNNTTGNENTAVGGSALSYNTTGYYNTAVGVGALNNNTSGTNNVGIGLNAGRTNKTGHQNVYVGAGAGNGPSNNSDVSNTTIIGYEAATNIATGANNNIVIGAYSAGNLTTGANNIVIGNNINTVAATSSGTLNIGNLIFGTSLNGSGATIATGNIGIGSKTPVTKLSVSGGLQISMESATCAVSFAGTLRYNSGNVEFCNGTSWSAFGVAGSGITTFNGSTSGTQTFAHGITGTAPLFVTANGVHTLNIPLASAGSVTAGLLSNADYTVFTNKITSSAASIAQVLGYVPASSTVLGNYLVKTNNLSDLSSSATARTNLGLGGFATVSSLNLGSASATGTLAAARLPAFAGDVSSVSGSASLTVDGIQGRSVLATAPTSGQVLAYNGSAWAPAALAVAGDFMKDGSVAMTGALKVSDGTVGAPSIAFASDTNTGFYKDYADSFALVANGSTMFSFGYGSMISAATNGVKINVASGTAAAPVYTFNGVHNSGMFSPGGQVLAFSTNSLERLRIDSSGNVGIGTTTPSEKLEVSGSVKATSFISTSDGRLKKNIQLISGLESVLKLNGYSYQWKANGQYDAGVIAQELEQVFPHAVVTDRQSGYKAVKYQYLIAPLINSIKELHEENGKLKEKNNELENRLRMIEKKLGIR